MIHAHRTSAPLVDEQPDQSPDTEVIVREPASRLALMAIIAAALGITGLSFATWVDFGVTEMRGTDAEALTGVSDGYLVAALGGIILLSAAVALFRPRWAITLLPTIAVASITVLAVSGYTIATRWTAAGVDGEGAFITDGDPATAPYAIACLAIGTGLLASLLAARQASRVS
jgi:hypothetical protein